MLGMRFMNNRKDGKDYGRIAKVERCDEKGKTVTLMYEDGNGGTTVSTATLKRWWKSVQKEEVMVEQQELDTTDVIVEDDKCGDGTPLAEVGKQIAKQAKQKSKTFKKEKKEQEKKVDVTELITTISNTLKNNGFEVYSNDNHKHRMKVMKENKCVCKVYVGRNKFSVSTTKTLAPVGYTPTSERNCPYACRFDMDYADMDTFKEFMMSINTTKEDK